MPPLPLFLSERPITRLNAAEMFLVAVLRLSVAPADLGADWRDGFRAAGIHNTGIPSFEALFSIIGVAARRCLDVRHIHCPILGLDEERLIQLVGFLQQAQPKQAFDILSDWLFPAAARMAIDPAKGLANALASVGLTIPMRKTAGPSPYGAYTQPGLTLFH